VDEVFKACLVQREGNHEGGGGIVEFHLISHCVTASPQGEAMNEDKGGYHAEVLQRIAN